MFLDGAPVVAPPTEAMKAINPEQINHAWAEEPMKETSLKVPMYQVNSIVKALSRDCL